MHLIKRNTSELWQIQLQLLPYQALFMEGHEVGLDSFVGFTLASYIIYIQPSKCLRSPG